eukprot:g6530.t1
MTKISSSSAKSTYTRGIEVLKQLRLLADELVDLDQASKTKTRDDKISSLGLRSSLLLLELKRCNREVFLALSESKEEVSKAKESLDAANLGLQNLEYEKQYLLREIERNQGFKTIEMDRISLVSPKVFEKETGRSLKSHEGDKHAYQLDRLAHELSTRQSQNEAEKELEFKRLAVEKQIAAKRDFLQDLPSRVRQIEKSTIPLQKYLKMPNSVNKKRYEKARNLPSPLYVLFCQLEGYVEAHLSANQEESSFQVHIYDPKHEREGRNESQSRKRKRKRDEALDDEEEGISNSNARDNALNVPKGLGVMLQVEVEHGKGRQSVDIIFRYLPSLNCVTAEARGHPNMFVLRNLLPGDDGEKAPSAAHAHIKLHSLQNSSNSEESFQFENVPDLEQSLFPPTSRARPYRWVQWLSGLCTIAATQNGEESNGKGGMNNAPIEPSTAVTMERLRARLLSHLVLDGILRDLSSNRQICVHPDSVQRMLRDVRTTAKLSHWTSAPRDGEGGIGRFLATITLSGHNLSASVEVFPDYPLRAPRFTLSFDSDSDSTAMSDLRAMEREVNVHYDELITSTASADMLLSHQLRCLQGCLQVYERAVASVPDPGITRRGRDRRLPFKFDFATQSFVHR